ncbi:MAG: DUF1194 domain-containing protein [Hyphomicrobiaceae bacterium]
MIVLTAILANCPLERSSATAPSCTLALALALDVSGSIDSGEYALQIEGLAAALRSQDVADAIQSAGLVYMTVLHWSGSVQQIQVVPWTRLRSASDIDDFANRILSYPRQFDKFSTAIGEALAFANAQFLELPTPCRRRVIDVSGDGRSNEGWSPNLIRDQVVRQGVTINGLAVLANDDELLAYFRRQVIGGAGSFVISADQFEDYPSAMRRKLLREILPPIAVR